MTEEERLKIREAKRKLKLARQYLMESKTALRYGGLRLATDGAYNANELVMKVSILLKNEGIPRRHGSISQKFSLLFVKEGPLDAKVGGEIKQGFKFRSKARYDEDFEITQEHAQHNINLAKTLIEFLEKELKEVGVDIDDKDA